MYIVPHAAVGASIAKYFGQGKGWLIFGWAWISHYVLDALPHTEVSTFLPTHPELNVATREELIVFSVDIILAAVIIVILKRLGWWKRWYWWGVLGAMLPDILDNIPGVNVWLRQFHPFDWLHQLHQWAHVDMSRDIWIWGVLMPLVVTGLAAWCFYATHRRKA